MLDTTSSSVVATSISTSENPDSVRSLVCITLELGGFQRDDGRLGQHEASDRRADRHRDDDLLDAHRRIVGAHGDDARDLPDALVKPAVRLCNAASEQAAV